DAALDGNGFPNRGDYGNAIVKLSTASGLSVADYFTMSTSIQESAADQDLGSGGAMLVPDLTDGMGVTRHLVIGAGKDGHMYVADRDNMGKINLSSPTVNSNPNIYQDIASALGSGVFSMPAYFNGTVYYAAVSGHLRAFPFTNA